MTHELAIEASSLTKSYGATQVLAGIDLQVKRGTVLCLLGPNGAGKTTIVRILTTLLAPDGGTARVAGFDILREPHRVRRAISVTGQHPTVDELLSGEENLQMIGRLCGLSHYEAHRRASELLGQFDLTGAARRRVTTYSGGMRRRLDLAAGLVARASVLFLDEPTTGLDLRTRLAMWQVIGGLADSGVTVFLTTQILEEADEIASRVAVLDAGQLVAEGTPAELKERVAPRRLDITVADAASFQEMACRLNSRLLTSDKGRLAISVRTDGEATSVRELLDELDPDRSRVTAFDVHHATLDDVFLVLTGHGTRRQTAGEPGDV